MNNLLQNKQDLDYTFQSINDIANLILADYTLDLNEYIDSIYQKWIINKEVPSDSELDDIISMIPLYLYRAVSVKESLATKEDLAKVIKDKAYNEALLKGTGTVAERQANADNSITSDKLAYLAYNTAYKIIQSKFDMALELLNSAKKVQNSRISERELSRRI